MKTRSKTKRPVAKKGAKRGAKATTKAATKAATKPTRTQRARTNPSPDPLADPKVLFRIALATIGSALGMKQLNPSLEEVVSHAEELHEEILGWRANYNDISKPPPASRPVLQIQETEAAEDAIDEDDLSSEQQIQEAEAAEGAAAIALGREVMASNPVELAANGVTATVDMPLDRRNQLSEHYDAELIEDA